MREGKSRNCHGLSPHNDVDDSSNVILSETKDLGDSMTVITRLEILRYAQNDAEGGDYGVRVYFYIPVSWVERVGDVGVGMWRVSIIPRSKATWGSL